MKVKKASASWYIAATHYLTAGFIAPLIIGLAYELLILPQIESLNENTLNVISIAVNLISVIGGVIYASSYLNKAYIIREKDKVVLFASIYFLVVSGGLLLAGNWMRGLLGVSNMWNILDYLLRLVTFYFTSKKLVQNNEEIVSTAPPSGGVVRVG